MTYIWAHRGASGYAPENTLEAYELADKMHADGIELDVQLSKDGQVVVCHDETIDRTSDHKGFIKDYTLSELKTFNFNNKNEKYSFCHIPTLEEVLKQVKPTNMIINIELKTGIFDYPTIEEKTIELVKKYAMEDRIVYSSFNHYTILNILKLNPQADCGFLHTDGIIDIADYAVKYNVKNLHPAFYFLLNERYYHEAIIHGLKINAWTINEEKYIQAALKLNINAIITNYPDLAINLCGK
ncbi:MAG: glycerophosphodiester phosphodiesterase [Erysipelotrichia bacterium]|nr:glycerophosphodiester phosphodiesterase [Erysipelotrichia bacterium]